MVVTMVATKESLLSKLNSAADSGADIDTSCGRQNAGRALYMGAYSNSKDSPHGLFTGALGPQQH